MNRSWLALLATALVSSCVLGPLPVVVHWTRYLGNAELEGRSRAEVLAELGPPTAVNADGSTLLYALRDANWTVFVLQRLFDIDPHWDVRFVDFDASGKVRIATPLAQRDEPFATLLEELQLRTWSR